MRTRDLLAMIPWMFGLDKLFDRKSRNKPGSETWLTEDNQDNGNELDAGHNEPCFKPSDDRY